MLNRNGGVMVFYHGLQDISGGQKKITWNIGVGGFEKMSEKKNEKHHSPHLHIL